MRPTFVLLTWVFAFSEAAGLDIHTKPGQFIMLTEYGYVYHPGGVNWFTFQVNVCTSARVQLYNDDSADYNYLVLIGGWGNRRSRIRSKRYTDDVLNEEDSLISCDDYRSFWISWGDGDIFAGRGLVPHQDVLMSLIKPTESPVAFRYVSVGHKQRDAYWKIARQGDIMTGATCGAGDAHSYGTPDLAFGFCEGSYWNFVGDQQWMVLPESVKVNMTSTPIWTVDAPHDIACARACHSRPPCVSFLYKGNEGKCEGYSENF